MKRQFIVTVTVEVNTHELDKYESYAGVEGYEQFVKETQSSVVERTNQFLGNGGEVITSSTREVHA